MHIALLTLRLQLPGCASLKEKRHRLKGLRDRFGRQPGIAVCESDLADSRHSAQWSFVAVGSSAAATNKLLDTVEQFVAESVDGLITARHREAL